MTTTRKFRYTETTFAHLRILALLFIPFFACWDYGGVLPWTQWAVVLATVILLVMSLPQLIFQPRKMLLTRWLVVICLGVAFAGFLQTVSLPSFVTAVLSRGTFYAHRDFVPPELREEALQSDDSSLHALARPCFPTSVAPQLTLDALLLPVLMAAFILLSARAFNNERRLLLGLAGLTVSGTIISFLGIADQIRPPESDSALLDIDGSTFGTFVNRNNAAAYLNIALAAAGGLIVWRYRWQRRLRPWDDRFDVTQADWYDLILERIRRLFSYSDTLIVVSLLAACVILTGILVGGSRGGFIGAVVGGVIAIWRAFARKKAFMQTAVVAMLAISCGLLLMLVGMTDQVRERLSTLLGDDFASDGRLSHWRDAIYTAWMYFPTGSGLGTYRFAYLPYQDSSAGNWFVNADNLYLEMMVEGGIWLPLMFIAGGLTVLSALRRLSRHEGEPHLAGLFATVWFAFAALVTSQTFDFGLLLPANYLSLAVLLGMTVGTADRWTRNKSIATHRYSSRRSHALTDEAIHNAEHPTLMPPQEYPANAPEPDNEVYEFIPPSDQERGSLVLLASKEITRITEPASEHPVFPKPIRSHSLGKSLTAFGDQFILAAIVTLLLVYATLDKRGAATVDYWLRMERQVASEGIQRGLLKTQVDRSLAECLSGRLYDSAGHLTLAKLQVLVDRAEAVQEYFTEPPESGLSSQEVWDFAAPEIRRAAFYSGSFSPELDPGIVLLKGQSLARLRKARAAALKAFFASPLDDAPRYLLLSLDFLSPNETVTRRLFEHIGVLRQNWAPSLQAAAMLAVVHPGAEVANKLWNRALVVQPNLLPSLWNQAKPVVTDQVFALALPESSSTLLQFAEMTRDSQVRANVLARAEVVLQNASPTPETAGLHYFELATLAKLNGNSSAARMHFAAAVANDPSATEWRYEYALALEEEGKISEAIEELRRCILQNPKQAQYQAKERELRNR